MRCSFVGLNVVSRALATVNIYPIKSTLERDVRR